MNPDSLISNLAFWIFILEWTFLAFVPNATPFVIILSNTLTYFCFVECKNGTYGYYCSGHCAGHCLNNCPWNKKSGHCERGCTPGYTDIDCSKRKWFLPLTIKNTCISSCSQTLFNRLMEGSKTGSILKIVYYFSLLFYYSISYTLFLLKLYNFSDIKMLKNWCLNQTIKTTDCVRTF